MRLWQRILLLVALFGIIIVVRFSGIDHYLTLETLKEQRDLLMQFVATNYRTAVLVYILLYIAIVVLALPLAALLNIAGGFLFGTLPAALYVTIGATVGALCSFLLVRHLIGAAIQAKFRAQLERFNYYVEQYGTAYLLSVHLIAIVPFFVINVLAGLTQISWWTFVWTTAVGIIPVTFIYTFAGEQLNRIDSIHDVLSWQVIFAFVLLGILSIAPITISYFRKRSVKR